MRLATLRSAGALYFEIRRESAANCRVSGVARRQIEVRAQLAESPAQARHPHAKAPRHLGLRERHVVDVDDRVRHGGGEALGSLRARSRGRKVIESVAGELFRAGPLARVEWEARHPAREGALEIRGDPLRLRAARAGRLLSDAPFAVDLGRW